MSESNLKPGWKVWRFEQMAFEVKDRIGRPVDSGLERYVGLGHLDTGSLKIWRWGSTSDVEKQKLLFKKGDIIFGRRNAYLRRIAVADFDGVCSAHAMVLRAHEDVVLSEFLPFFMQTDRFWETALKVSAGSMSPTINWRNIAREEFALPPLGEQRRITKILDAKQILLEDLDNAEVASRKLLSSRIFNISQSFEHQHFRNAAIKITSGSRGWAKYYSADGPWFLRAGNLTRDSIELDLSGLKRVSPPDGAEGRRTKVETGDILVAITGIYLGKIALITKEVPEAYVNQHLALVRIDQTRFDSQFIAHMLTSPLAQREVWRRNDGGTKPGMTLTEVGNLPIPNVTLKRQSDLERSLEHINEGIHAIRNRREDLQYLYRATLEQTLGLSSDDV